MVDGKKLVQKLISYAEQNLYLNGLDIAYIKNRLLREFKLDAPIYTDITVTDALPDELIEEIALFASENKLVKDGAEELFATSIFGLITPLPSVINKQFKHLREQFGSVAACGYFYGLCVKNGYVKKSAIEKNLRWEHFDGKSFLSITVNLSKPEKDNRDIARLVKKKDEGYPKCLLCQENEGFYGSFSLPAKSNLRTISLEVGGENWFFQYSPYAYFNEHSILINKEHRPMKIDGDTVEKLLDFIEYIPDYFIGSNADLPIVGGSILNHEHYQAGRNVMPLKKANSLYLLSSENYPDVEVCVVDWHTNVIRLSGYNRNTLQQLASEIIAAWKSYRDESSMIFNNGLDTVRHNSCTLIAFFGNDGRYTLDIIPRNNYTTEQYPDGLFHAHPEYHNIKKEGIGLVEMSGLFVLPGRLKKEFELIRDILTGKTEYAEAELEKPENELYVHRKMVEKLLSEGLISDEQKAEEKIREYVGNACVGILENTRIFSNDSSGAIALKKFLQTVGIK